NPQRRSKNRPTEKQAPTRVTILQFSAYRWHEELCNYKTPIAALDARSAPNAPPKRPGNLQIATPTHRAPLRTPRVLTAKRPAAATTTAQNKAVVQRKTIV